MPRIQHASNYRCLIITIFVLVEFLGRAIVRITTAALKGVGSQCLTTNSSYAKSYEQCVQRVAEAQGNAITYTFTSRICSVHSCPQKKIYVKSLYVGQVSAISAVAGKCLFVDLYTSSTSLLVCR